VWKILSELCGKKTTKNSRNKIFMHVILFEKNKKLLAGNKAHKNERDLRPSIL
jgi:hypothetical protein